MSIDQAGKNLKIPTHHYVGFQARSSDTVPLGFMTPDGTDAAATKRKGTVDSWASQGNRSYNHSTGQYETKKAIPSVSYENKKLTGFKLGKEVRHGYGWGQGNVKWRIEDPRGFELEISSPNLAQIMLCTTIETGEILEECIWGRLGSENILIPVSSELYKNATVNTVRANRKVGLKDITPGDYVILQNGEEGVYLGSHFCFEDHGVRTQGSSDTKTGWYPKRRFFMAQVEDGKITRIDIKASLKPSEASDGDLGKLTAEKAEALINDYINNSERRQIRTAGYSYGSVKGVSCEKPNEADATYTYVVRSFQDLMDFYNPTKNKHYPDRYDIDYRVETRNLVLVSPNSLGQSVYKMVEAKTLVTKTLTYREKKSLGTLKVPTSSFYGTRGIEEKALHYVDLNQEAAAKADLEKISRSGSGYYHHYNDYTDSKRFVDLEDVENGVYTFQEVQATFTTPTGRTVSFFL